MAYRQHSLPPDRFRPPLAAVTVALSRCRGASYTGFAADARPPRAGVSGRYPVIPPVELPVIQTTVFVVCPLTFYLQRTSLTHAEFFTGLFALALGVEDQGVHQLQNVFLLADVRQRVIPHGLLEVDEV